MIKTKYAKLCRIHKAARSLLLMEIQVVVDKMHFMKIYEAQIAQMKNGLMSILLVLLYL